jgi:hypothetical protein
VVSGVAPETGGTATVAFLPRVPPQPAPADEIRRDAGFDGRNARSTHFENTPWSSWFRHSPLTHELA